MDILPAIGRQLRLSPYARSQRNTTTPFVGLKQVAEVTREVAAAARRALGPGQPAGVAQVVGVGQNGWFARRPDAVAVGTGDARERAGQPRQKRSLHSARTITGDA